MKLGKYINGDFALVECEGGKEVNGSRTEEVLYADGWKKACPSEGEGEYQWREYPTCFVQEFLPVEEEPIEEAA